MTTSKEPSRIDSHYRTPLLSITRIHYIFAALLAFQIVIYDAWKLLAPEAVLQRWFVVGILATVTTVVWFLLRTVKTMPDIYLRLLAMTLILTDIGVASFGVYSQRGMASRAVMLYVIPLLVASILMSRAAIYATATLSVIAYVITAISYFVLNFNEGYKIELYGEVGFYSCLLFILSALLWVLVRTRKTKDL